MRVLSYITTQQDAGHPVRSIVPRRFQLGTHAFRRLKVENAILLDGKPVRANCILSAGQTLQILLENGTSIPEAEGDSLIVHIDEDMIVVNKPAPLATLPSRHIQTQTLRELLAEQLNEDPRTFAYHPVNRLDKGTSGLLCIARHAHAQRLLSAQLHSGRFIRDYLAVTEGIPKNREGVIDAPIIRENTGAKRIIREDGQRAITHYSVEQTAGKRALIRLRLETGRTHQIRVHLSSIGCPIAGDYLYGRELPELGGRFALHSFYLSCLQPLTGQTLCLNAPLPDSLSALLND